MGLVGGGGGCRETSHISKHPNEAALMLVVKQTPRSCPLLPSACDQFSTPSRKWKMFYYFLRWLVKYLSPCHFLKNSYLFLQLMGSFFNFSLFPFSLYSFPVDTLVSGMAMSFSL